MPYAWKLVSAVTASRRTAFLFDVQVSELAAGGFGDADFVRAGVVGLPSAL